MKKNIFKTGLMVIAMAAAASCSGYLDDERALEILVKVSAA